MKSILKYLLLLVLVVGIVFALLQFNPFKDRVVRQDSTTVLNKINKVLKLVTVEAQLSELFEHEEFYGYDISPFRKKVIVRVRGNVLAGFDMEKIKFEIDERARTIRVLSWSKAEILSIDHELDYYDISEGLFNSFSKNDYTEIQAMAKNKIRLSAEQSGVLEAATNHLEEMKTILTDVAKSGGWEFEWKSGFSGALPSGVGNKH